MEKLPTYALKNLHLNDEITHNQQVWQFNYNRKSEIPIISFHERNGNMKMIHIILQAKKFTVTLLRNNNVSYWSLCPTIGIASNQNLTSINLLFEIWNFILLPNINQAMDVSLTKTKAASNDERSSEQAMEKVN